MLVNPLRATAPVAPQEASPYSPTSRRFLNPLYLDVDAIEASVADEHVVADLRAAGRALDDVRRIDRDAVHRLKMDALARLFDHAPRDAAFDAWFAADDAVRRFAAWSVLVERHGADWRRWPVPVRRPDGSGVEELLASDGGRVRFHGWLQWLARRQLDNVTATTRLVQDLPIGFDRDGMDAWVWQDLLAPGVTVGAPPDEFIPAGQDWGLPAFVPGRLSAAGYEPFIDTIRASLTQAGGLRIDHVMGLFRLWWIPDGAARPTAPTCATRSTTCSTSWPWKAFVTRPSSSGRTSARSNLAYGRSLQLDTCCPTGCCGLKRTHRACGPRRRWRRSRLTTFRPCGACGTAATSPRCTDSTYPPTKKRWTPFGTASLA